MVSSKKTPTKPAEKPVVHSSGKKKTSKRSWDYSHLPSSDYSRNGRQEGRSLIPWTRPRMAEKLLLHIQYECNRHKCEMPWDSIAHRFHPGSSGGAILQHIARLRNTLISEGHLVPPVTQKPGSRAVIDPAIRGYLRKNPEGHEDVHSVRPVAFTEPVEDRRFNFPDAVDINRKGQIGEVSESAASPVPTVGRKRGRAIIKAESPDPADLDSDEEYVPGASTALVRRSGRASKKAKSYAEAYVDEDGEEEEAQNDDDENSGRDGEQDYEEYAEQEIKEADSAEDFADDEAEDSQAVKTIEENGASEAANSAPYSSQAGTKDEDTTPNAVVGPMYIPEGNFYILPAFGSHAPLPPYAMTASGPNNPQDHRVMMPMPLMGHPQDGAAMNYGFSFVHQNYPQGLGQFYQPFTSPHSSPPASTSLLPHRPTNGLDCTGAKGSQSSISSQVQTPTHKAIVKPEANEADTDEKAAHDDDDVRKTFEDLTNHDQYPV